MWCDVAVVEVVDEVAVVVSSFGCVVVPSSSSSWLGLTVGIHPGGIHQRVTTTTTVVVVMVVVERGGGKKRVT